MGKFVEVISDLCTICRFALTGRRRAPILFSSTIAAVLRPVELPCASPLPLLLSPPCQGRPSETGG